MKKLLLNFVFNVIFSSTVTLLLAFLLIAYGVEKQRAVTVIYALFFSFFVCYYSFTTTCRALPSQFNFPRLVKPASTLNLIKDLGFSFVAIAAVMAIISFLHGWPTVVMPSAGVLTTFGLFLVIAAAFEEVLFRGYLYLLVAQFTLRLSAIVSGLIFALVHFPYNYGVLEFLAHFVFALLAARLTVRNKSLFPAITIHLILNFFADFSGTMIQATGMPFGILQFTGGNPTETFLAAQVVVFSMYYFILSSVESKYLR